MFRVTIKRSDSGKYYVHNDRGETIAQAWVPENVVTITELAEFFYPGDVVSVGVEGPNVIAKISEFRRAENPDRPVWQSYVWHKEQAFYVSTIDRRYDTAVGETRGLETLVWTWDEETKTRGEMIGHMGGLEHHHAICRCLIATGEMLDEYNEQHERFLRGVR